MLLECARSSVRQTSALQALGLVLGIREWGDNFNQRLIAPKECLEAISLMEEEFDDVVAVGNNKYLSNEMCLIIFYLFFYNDIKISLKKHILVYDNYK